MVCEGQDFSCIVGFFLSFYYTIPSKGGWMSLGMLGKNMANKQSKGGE